MKINKTKTILGKVALAKKADEMEQDSSRPLIEMQVAYKALEAIIAEIAELLNKGDTRKFFMNEVAPNSRSRYRLTSEEFFAGVARFLVTGWEFNRVIRHNRGKLPGAYKWSPTSQCVSITIKKETKAFWLISVEQIGS